MIQWKLIYFVKSKIYFSNVSLIFDHLQGKSRNDRPKVHFKTTYHVQLVFSFDNNYYYRALRGFGEYLSFQMTECFAMMRNNNRLHNNCHWKISTLYEARGVTFEIIGYTTASVNFIVRQKGKQFWFSMPT